MNSYRRTLTWILGPFAGLLTVLTIFAAATGFISWLPPLVATILVLLGGAIVWINLGKAPQKKS